MNITLIYKKAEESFVEEKILPSLTGFHVQQEPVEDDIDVHHIHRAHHRLIITYLPYDELMKTLRWAVQDKIQITILPHPDDSGLASSLGITDNIEDILEDIKTREAATHIEMLYCNGAPVFESVKIGTFFTKEDNSNTATWVKRWRKFISAVLNYRNIIHQPFSMKSGDEKLIETSAIGLLAVEHTKNSILSRQWDAEEEPGDGQFHFFIVSPKNAFELIRYIFNSVVKKPSKKIKRPDFIGYIRIHSLEVTGSGPIKYFHDGKELESDKLELNVIRDHLLLFQNSDYGQKDLSEEPKKSLRLKGLPTGETRNAIIGKNIPWLPRASSEDFKDLFIQLRSKASTSSEYMVMLVLSTLIATFGLYGNSSPVIIGAMILAPLMSPIVAFAMGVVRYDTMLLREGLKTIFWGTLVALGVTVMITQIIPLEIMTGEMQARLSPTLLDLGIAVASGIAAAYVHAKEGIAQSIAGVAIAVALVPPLAVSGIGIGWWNWHIFSGAFLLYLTNLAGIILFAGFTFWILGFTPFKRAGKGLLYTFFIVILLGVPLSFSFNHIIEEARITQLLEGHQIDNYVFKEVEVRYGDPVAIEFKLVTPYSISDVDLRKLKQEIHQIVGEDVTISIISSIEF